MLDRDLADPAPFGLGRPPPGWTVFRRKILTIFRAAVEKILEQGGVPLCIGGEHTVTLPIIKALKKHFGKFVILHLDAHSDLRDSYEGQKINHSTVMRPRSRDNRS